MRHKITIFSIIVLFLLPIVNSYDLSDFPEMFLEDGDIKENSVIIVGKASHAEDVLGSIDIALMLQRKAGNKNLDLARLDTEVKDISAYRSIVVGGPCINSIAANLMGYPQNCMQGFEIGKAFIKLYEFDNDKFSILIAGTTALDTRRATYVLSYYDDYDLEGSERIVSGLSTSDIKINLNS